MASRDIWLDKGLEVLSAEGIRAVTIERLCDEVGLSKGSFYHHFGGVSGFHQQLLDHFGATETERYVGLAESDPTLDARARFDRLREAVIADADGSAAVERAVRAWAAQDPVAEAALRSIDEQRLGYLEELLRPLVPSRTEALEVARSIYLILLGSFHVLPPLPLTDVERLWNRVIAGL